MMWVCYTYRYDYRADRMGEFGDNQTDPHTIPANLCHGVGDLSH